MRGALVSGMYGSVPRQLGTPGFWTRDQIQFAGLGSHLCVSRHHAPQSATIHWTCSMGAESLAFYYILCFRPSMGLVPCMTAPKPACSYAFAQPTATRWSRLTSSQTQFELLALRCVATPLQPNPRKKNNKNEIKRPTPSIPHHHRPWHTSGECSVCDLIKI